MWNFEIHSTISTGEMIIFENNVKLHQQEQRLIDAEPSEVFIKCENFENRSMEL